MSKILGRRFSGPIWGIAGLPMSAAYFGLPAWIETFSEQPVPGPLQVQVDVYLGDAPPADPAQPDVGVADWAIAHPRVRFEDGSTLGLATRGGKLIANVRPRLSATSRFIDVEVVGGDTTSIDVLPARIFPVAILIRSEEVSWIILIDEATDQFARVRTLTFSRSKTP